MGNDQQPLAGPSKTGKKQSFRFSQEAKTFLRDYFHKTNKTPKKKERQQILAHIKELGDTEATDIRIVGWFGYRRQVERQLSSSQSLSTSATEPSEKTWVDVRHKTLWPSLTKETLSHLEDLYTDHVDKNKNAEPPHDLWAKGLHARADHVDLWCKIRARESTCPALPDTASMATTSSQVMEEHSQLPTPGTSTSPEPHSTFVASPSLSPSTIKYEPPASPVVETTRFQQQAEGPKEKSSMGLHEAIETAFSAPLCPPAPYIQPPKPPSPTKKSSSRTPRRTIDVIPPPSPLSISTNTASALTPISLPSASIASSPSKPDPSPILPYREPSAPPSPEEPIPGPSTQPDRDIAHERADLTTGIAEKLDELAVMFNSPFGMSQLAGSIERISQRNQQFLNDVAAGRFAHMRLTSAHLAGHQVPSPVPEFNPQRILAKRRNVKEKGKEREQEDEMEVD